jgi:hypothetical protein
MGYAYEFPHYFDFCARFQAHSVSVDPGSHEGACGAAADEAIGAVVRAIQVGIEDGSIRRDVGEPVMLAVTLWAFTHGIIQLAMAKGSDLARLGIAIPDLSSYALGLLRSVMQAVPEAQNAAALLTKPRIS